MRVVVTGASGFVGTALVQVLRARGHDVSAPDRAALRSPSTMLGGAHALVHLAALAHARGVDEGRLYRTNVELPAALGRAAARAAVPMVFISTAKVLGEEGLFDENSAPAPGDAYARAKAQAEAALGSVDGLALAILRPPLVYGPGVKANFRALAGAIARGWPLPFASIDNRRSLIHVDNLADAIAHCVESRPFRSGTWLVSDGAPISTPALCRELGDALGRRARLFCCPATLLELARPARKLTRSLVADNSAFRRDFHWKPPLSSEQGLRQTAEWLRARG